MPLSSQQKNQHLLWRAGFGVDVNLLEKVNNTNHKEIFSSLQKASPSEVEYFDVADNSIKGIFMGVGDAVKIQELIKNGLDNETKKKIRQQSREDIKNIKEVGDAPTSDANGEASKSEQGRFYKTIEDYINKKPSNEVKIKNGSYVWGTLGGERLKVIDKNGNIETEKISNFSGMFFTYRGEYSTSFDLYMAVDGGAYSVLRAGKISLYTHREATGNGGEKDVLYYSNSETKGEVKKFKEKNLEDWLESANLLEDYNKEKPKREFKDDKSDYYTKEVSRYLKYTDILNKK